MSDEDSSDLDRMESELTQEQPETSTPRNKGGRPKGSKNKKAGQTLRSVPPPQVDPEQLRQQSLFAVSILISIPIQVMKLEPYSESEAAMMSSATLPVLEKYAGEWLTYLGPEFALLGTAILVLGPKIQKRKLEVSRENVSDPGNRDIRNRENAA